MGIAGTKVWDGFCLGNYLTWQIVSQGVHICYTSRLLTALNPEALLLVSYFLFPKILISM